MRCFFCGVGLRRQGLQLQAGAVKSGVQAGCAEFHQRSLAFHHADCTSAWSGRLAAAVVRVCVLGARGGGGG